MPPYDFYTYLEAMMPAAGGAIANATGGLGSQAVQNINQATNQAQTAASTAVATSPVTHLTNAQNEIASAVKLSGRLNPNLVPYLQSLSVTLGQLLASAQQSEIQARQASVNPAQAFAAAAQGAAKTTTGLT